jgi:hypothetical protein
MDCPACEASNRTDTTRFFGVHPQPDGTFMVVPAVDTSCWVGRHPKDENGKCQCDDAVEAFRACPVHGDNKKDPNEFERVCWVFGLTGGEMDIRDKAWLGHAYHYDGAPDYATKDMKEAAEEEGLDPSTIATVLVFGGGYLSPAEETITDDKGKVWHLLSTFNSSGECECPGQHEDDKNKVRKEHCGPNARHGDYDPDDYGAEWVDGVRVTKAEPDRCVLCEADRGDEHEMISIDEGYEAVYATEAAEDES